MFEIINKQLQFIRKAKLNIDHVVDFQSCSSNPLAEVNTTGIPHGNNSLDDVPRYGQALEKTRPNIDVKKASADNIGVVTKPVNQALVPNSEMHPRSDRSGREALDVSTVLADSEPKPDWHEDILESKIDPDNGFTARRKNVWFGGEPTELTSYHNKLGHYIGDKKWADMLFQKGINPELADETHKTCSVGFSTKDNKWYGWSHRAMNGFEQGSTVRKGDCAYRPATPEEAVEDRLRWEKDIMEAPEATVKLLNPNEMKVDARYKSNMIFSKIEPVELGKGEWVANDLDDARQMAVDFARSVSTSLNTDVEPPVAWESESSAKYSPLNYVWYTYQGNKTKPIADIKGSVSLDLNAGDKFGIYYLPETKMVRLAVAEDLSYEFEVSSRMVNGWLKKSKPFGGKVETLKVVRGNGKVDQYSTAKPVTRTRNLSEPKIKLLNEEPTKESKPKASSSKPKEPELKPSKGLRTVRTQKEADNLISQEHEEAQKDPETTEVNVDSKVNNQKIAKNPKVRVVRGGKPKEVYVCFFKPDADRPRYRVLVGFRKDQLEKSAIEICKTQPNLGSKIFITKMPENEKIISKIGDKGWLGERHADRISNRFEVKTVKHVQKLGAKSIEFEQRNLKPIEISKPRFSGGEELVLRELRDQIIRDKKLTTAFELRQPNAKTKPINKGLSQKEGVPFLQLLSLGSEERYEDEGVGLIRRLKKDTNNGFVGRGSWLDVIIDNVKQKRYVVNIFANVGKGNDELRKRNRQIYKRLSNPVEFSSTFRYRAIFEDEGKDTERKKYIAEHDVKRVESKEGGIVKNAQYLVERGGTMLTVVFLRPNWETGGLMVRELRRTSKTTGALDSNVDANGNFVFEGVGKEFEVDSLFTVGSREKVI